jgi:hypothetical protein
MHTFAKKSKAPQQTAPAKSAIIGGIQNSQSPQVNSILQLQRTNVNQAVQRQLQATAKDFQGGSAAAESDCFGHDFSKVRIHAAGKAAEYGTSGSGDSLPYLAKIQPSFGRHNVSHVRAHQGPQAAEASHAMSARAYTYGSHVAFAGSPDLRTAAHEAAHVVQQRAGVQLVGDIGDVGDGYERHAEAVADRVISSRSAEALLDRMAPAAGSRALGVQRRIVQRAPIPTDYGNFDTTKYDKVGSAGSEYGVLINLSFDPDKTKVNAKKIGLTQAVRTQLGGVAVAIEPSRRQRMVPSGAAEGYEIDRTTASAYGNPIYATNVPNTGDKLGDTPMLSHGKWGWNYKDASGKNQHEIAKLEDQPTQPGRGNNSGQSFETTALAVEGAQAGTYMGSVTWGWSVDGAGKFSQLPVALKSKGNPSSIFVEAAKQWNKWSTAGTIKTNANPTNVYDSSFSVAFTVAKDTEVTVVAGDYINANIPYNEATINSGPQKGKIGRIKVADMTDVGGGNPTIKLPIP